MVIEILNWEKHNLRKKQKFYLYCFISKDLNVKIGSTWNISLRKKTLERHHGTLSLFGAIAYSTDEYSTRSTEQIIHKKLKEILDIKSRGEWYPLRPIVLDYFIQKTGALKCHQF